MYKYIVSPGNNGAIVKTALEARGCWTEASEAETQDLRAHLIWKQTILPIRALQILEHHMEKGYPQALHNHLDNNREITTKPGLIRSLRAYYQTCEGAVHNNYHAYDSMATSFIITASCEDLEYHSLISRHMELQNGSITKERMPAKHCQENIWLIKPAALNQGRGIEICHSLKEIKSILGSKLPNSVWVVQKYIEKPLLFKGRKFDIRVWALATARKELFFFKHGYLRTSSFDYNTEAKDNYIHLTNNCLQKWGDNYGIHEAGNTLSFEAFQAYLDEHHPDLQVNVQEHIIPRIKDLVLDSYLSARKILHGSKRKSAFELLGYDFLVDEDFRVWLLEVNTNPYLGIPNDYIKDLLPVMLDDMLAIAVDPYYSPSTPRKRSENDFELLYCETSSPWSPDGLGKNYRRPFTVPVYPFPALAQVSLCRQNLAFHTSTQSAGRSDEEPDAKPRPPVIVRDTYSTIREILDSQLFFDVSDFYVIASRIMSHLQNWELASKEQIGSAVQALRLLCGSPGNVSLISYGHMSSLLGFVQSENMPTYVQVGVVDALIAGCADTRFKREMAKSNILLLLIPLILAPRDEENLFPKHLQLLLAMGRHPTKNIYIPGETRENNIIRQTFIAQGGLTCLYKLSQEAAEESVRNEISQHLSSEYGLADWDVEVKILGKALKSKDRSSADSKPTQHDDLPGKSQSAKKQYSPDTSFGGNSRHLQALFPEALMDPALLRRIRNEIEEFCELRRNEIKQRQVEETRRKEAEFDEKLRQREEEDRAYEDRRQKAENEMIRRYLERKQKKLEEMKKQLQEKEMEDRLDEERRQTLIEKIKKQEEIRKFEKMKKKQEIEDQKRIDDEKQRQQEERRREALTEWLKVKGEQERERKLKEKLKREREEAKRLEELNQRRIELQVKLDERKGKRVKPEVPKAKDNPPPSHQSLVVASFVENMELTKQKSTRFDTKEEVKSTRAKAEVVDTKAVLHPQPQQTKKRKVITDQLLLEVYRQFPGFSGKKRKGKRANSKTEAIPEGDISVTHDEEEHGRFPSL